LELVQDAIFGDLPHHESIGITGVSIVKLWKFDVDTPISIKTYSLLNTGQWR
jgi:hypothetical protein